MDEIVCIGLFAKKEPKLFSFLFMRANVFEERKEINFLSSNEDNWIIREIYGFKRNAAKREAGRI